ncbi:MAG: zinc ribbon domain-containing protein [Thermoplasmata archaeon]|nr:MAG: zinc ribbon domain-containing protein [Thermoplasmata archaeon]
MPVDDIRDTLLTVVFIVGVIVITIMVFRIMLKVRRGSKPKNMKEPRVLKAVSATPDMDDLFNAITSSRRIATDLKRRGIDTSSADDLISKASEEYEIGREAKAKLYISEAKELLLRSKKEWDEKTGFDVVPITSTMGEKPTLKKTLDVADEASLSTSEPVKPDEVFPELKKAEKKKPDNYLPSKFTISLAGTAIENAQREGANVGEAQRYLIEAKAYFDREDYDGAFKSALCSKREAEALLGMAPTTGEERKRVMSDLAMDTEELKICSICGKNRIPYICIEVAGGEEATCKECYDRSMGKIALEEKKLPPPPPPPPEEKEEEKGEEQNFCPNCGAKVKEDDVFCGKCGKPVQEELKCAGCGTKIEPGDVFCRKCGARMVT